MADLDLQIKGGFPVSGAVLNMVQSLNIIQYCRDLLCSLLQFLDIVTFSCHAFCLLYCKSLILWRYLVMLLAYTHFCSFVLSRCLVTLSACLHCKSLILWRYLFVLLAYMHFCSFVLSRCLVTFSACLYRRFLTMQR